MIKINSGSTKGVAQVTSQGYLMVCPCQDCGKSISIEDFIKRFDGCKITVVQPEEKEE